MKPKFNIGDKVYFNGDSKEEAGEVIGFSYNQEVGFSYTISSKEVDIKAKKIIDGVKHCTEDELVLVVEDEVQE